MTVRFSVLPQWVRRALRESEVEVISPGFEVRRASAPCPDGYSLAVSETKIFCMDCGDEDSLDFMVSAQTWKEAGLDRGRICLTCLQNRLPRELRLADFPKVPLNGHIHLGARLAATSHKRKMAFALNALPRGQTPEGSNER